MLNQLTSLLYIFYKDSNYEENNKERFIIFCCVVAILHVIGRIMNIIYLDGKAKVSKFALTAEIILGCSTFVLIIYYFAIYFLEWSFLSVEIFFGLLLLWIIESAFYSSLNEIGIQSMLSVFITTNLLLLCGEITLRGCNNIHNIFEYSSINLIVLCAQFSWAGEPATKKTNSLFYIISRQDCFRLMVYFLLFNLLNNTIRSFTSNISAITPTIASIIPYIWATTKFNQRRYQQAFGLFIVSLLIYFPLEITITQQILATSQ